MPKIGNTMESKVPDISIEEIMQRIKDEVSRRRKSDLSAEFPRSEATFSEPPQIPSATEPSASPSRLDRFLWKYGTRYARTINRIPLLKEIAQRQHMRLSLTRACSTPSYSVAPAQGEGLQFLETNWYYHDFFEEVKREGLKGKIKLFLLKYIGFFAWWQAQINRMIHQELVRQRREVAERDRRIEDLLHQEIEGVKTEFAQTCRVGEEHFSNGMGAIRAEFSEALEQAAQDIKGSVEVVKGAVENILRQVRDHRFNILDQQRRVALLLEEARKRMGEPLSPKQTEKFLKEEEHLLDALYVAFEDRFRGTREEIKKDQRRYLPYIAEIRAGTPEAPVVDIGCGRGEWLELLREGHYVAKGVDVNRVMVQHCQEFGLDVVEADMIEFLRRQRSNSLGAITGFHVVEHLSLSDLIALFDESLRTLKLGGMVFFETPNPTNLLVSSYDFYRDPSHVKPLHPDTLQFLLEMRGFVRTGAYFTNGESPDSPLIQSTQWNLDRLESYLTVSRNYVLMGYKG